MSFVINTISDMRQMRKYRGYECAASSTWRSIGGGSLFGTASPVRIVPENLPVCRENVGERPYPISYPIVYPTMYPTVG
jgi:hypothetical protein